MRDAEESERLRLTAELADATSFTPLALAACHGIPEAEAFAMLLRWEGRGIVKRLNATGDSWRWANDPTE